MDFANIIDRKAEIELKIQSNNLDVATKRVMDFVTDFSESKSKRREATNIRANFTVLRKEHRISGIMTREIEQRFNSLRNQILDLIDEIEEGFASIEEESEHVELDYKNIVTKVIKTHDSYEKAKQNFKNMHPFTSFGKQEDCVFYAKKITKTYKNKSIGFSLEPTDLELRYGEITALVGENGNGKSTILNIVSGKMAHSSGEIFYPIFDSQNKKDWYDIKTNIAYIEQDLPKWKGFLKDNLHFTLGVNGIKGQENIDEVNFIIHRLGLEKYADAKWEEISGGFKMRFSLARAILRKPKLLILDEPLANLDINTQNLFLTDLRYITNSIKNKISVMVSSQDLYQIEKIADNIIFLSDGEALYNGRMKSFGEDREENSFEVGITINEDDFLTILDSVAYTRIKKDGYDYIIDTKKSVTSKELLELFLQHDLEVQYFRDISKSTRKLFGEIK